MRIERPRAARPLGTSTWGKNDAYSDDSNDGGHGDMIGGEPGIGQQRDGANQYDDLRDDSEPKPAPESLLHKPNFSMRR